MKRGDIVRSKDHGGVYEVIAVTPDKIHVKACYATLDHDEAELLMKGPPVPELDLTDRLAISAVKNGESE